MEGSIFPRSDLCQQIKKKEYDKSFYCYLPDQHDWMIDPYEIPYYQLETQFLADLYSYLLSVDYDRNNPCSFVQQYRTSSAYLNQLTSYLTDHPSVENLIFFYQYQGDSILNNYLRVCLPMSTNLRPVISYMINHREAIKNTIDSSEPQHKGFRRVLEQYGWSIDQFKVDLDSFRLDKFRVHLDKNYLDELGLKYKIFFDQAARDLQVSILRAPPMTNELITFRYAMNIDYFNLGEGQITRLTGFTSTTIHHGYLQNYPGLINSFKMMFIIPSNFPVLPFIHHNLVNEGEILLPHGTRVVHERTLTINHQFDMIPQVSTYLYHQDREKLRESGNPSEVKPRYDSYSKEHENIYCIDSEPLDIYIFRVLYDPWEVQAALNYNPLNYNLYGPCLDSVSEQTGVSIETLKRLAEQHLFSR